MNKAAKNYKVYMHIAPNGKRYIGITCNNVKSRWGRGRGYIGNKHFYNAIQKYGWENIEHRILYRGMSEEDAKRKEVELIAKYNTTDPLKGYNKTAGGDTTTPLYGKANGMYGRGHTKATRELQSAIAKKRFKKKENHPMYGTHRSEETKRKLSEAKKGLNKGEKNYFYGKNLSGKQAWRYGMKHSEETKRKLSEARKGRFMGEKAYNSLPVRCVETGEEFSCAMEVKRKYGYDNSHISKCCKNDRAAHGYHWEYVHR